ncbi:unnamed protein product [Phyllotreta striolata]|uniref:Uncharacterized protein n=1 Tax=Phyllotreta striolata TaxID=444603 RepID=A0A9N9XQR8_PHYSR|nr:unnamed protein product [Phyllotreta striolata]
MRKIPPVCLVLFFLTLVGGIKKKTINIGIFLNDDDHYETSTIALTSVVRRINLYTKVEYLLRPHIFRTQKHEIWKTGQTACNLLRKGVAAIFGPEHPEINSMIQSISTNLEIPQFQTFWNPLQAPFVTNQQPEKPLQIFNLHPSPWSLSKALATLIRENDWKSYAILYESDEALLRLEQPLNQLHPNDPAVAFKALGSPENYRVVLKEVKNSGVLHFVLDCEVERIMDVLKIAKEQNLMTEFHSYILTNLDAHTLDWSELKNIRSNITALRMIDPADPHVKNAALIWNQNMKYDILDTVKNAAIQKELNRTRPKRRTYNDILPSKLLTKTILLYDALNLFISIFSELDSKLNVTLRPLSCESNLTSEHGRLFSDLLILKRNHHLLLQPLTGPITRFDTIGYRRAYRLQIVELEEAKFRVTGTWDSSAPDKLNLTLTQEERVTELKKKIQKRNFRVVSRLGDPYLMRLPDPPGKPLLGNDRFEGYAVDLVSEICKPQHLNCSYTFELVPDGMYGNFDPVTKKWNGIIKELLEYRADLGICDLTITYERRKAVDFTNPFMYLGISILFSKAVKAPPDLLTFSHPLSFEVWIYIATSYLIVSLIMFIVARLNPNDWENPHPCNPYPSERENIWTFRNCCWLTMGSFMTQGCDLLPKGISTRLVVAMWWFFALIMTACYTANMTAFLTSSRMGSTIESAEDLAAQTKIKYGCVDGGATSSFFKDTNFSTYHRMWVQMESADPSVFEKSNKDGVKRVVSSKRKYAFVMESSNIEYEMERNCDLVQVGNLLDSKGYGIAVPFNAPYRKAINEVLLKMQEMGLLQTLKDRWWKEKHGGGKCTKDKQSDDAAATEMGFDNVGGVFVVLAIGVVFSLMMAVCEFLWNVRKVAVRQKITPKAALIQELKFAVNIWARQKTVNAAISMEKFD